MGTSGSTSSAFCVFAAVAAAAAPAAAHSVGKSGSSASPQHGSNSPRLRKDPITMDFFKQAMLGHYSSARDAFAALDARSATDEAALDEAPLSRAAFVRGTRSFRPPLSDEQATFAFRGLDADGNGQLVVDEFLEGLHAGGFFRASIKGTAVDASKGQRAVVRAPVSMAEFKERMLRVYKTAPDAFAALDSSERDLTAALDSKPVNLKKFCNGVKSFIPPLTEEQGMYAFKALDVDDNGILVSAEFSEGLSKNEFRALETSTIPMFSTTTSFTTSMITTTMTVTTTPPPTTTKTTTATTSRQAAGMSNPFPNAVVITIGDFKSRMLNAHESELRAFQALDANPCDLEGFIRGTRSFKPPLTRQEAEYAFRGLDADHDDALSSYEFFEVLESGKFFPTLRDLVVMGTSRATVNLRSSVTAAHDPASVSDKGPATAGAAAAPWVSQRSAAAARHSELLSKMVALAAVCPVGCLLLFFFRSFGPQLLRGSRKMLGMESHNSGGSDLASVSSDSLRSETSLVDKHAKKRRHSRWFGSGSFLGCCVRSNYDEFPMLDRSPSSTPGESPNVR